MAPIFPPIEPFKTHNLEVSHGHTIYVEECGNPQSNNAVLFVHGGPGGGISKTDRQWFDPEHYRIVLFDQRGSGKSVPSADLNANTTWHLVEDMEVIRKTLGISKWVVFGGSWGSTLSLTYAITHPEFVKGLILRGIFLLRDSEIKWFYQEGATNIFPDYFEEYLEPIPIDERDNLVKAYYSRLTSTDEATRLKAASHWSKYECATSRLLVDEETVAKASNPKWANEFARIECHYFVNKGFFDKDGWLLDNAHKIAHIPVAIVQGRYDVVCPMNSAWDLKKKLPDAQLFISPSSGHSAKEAETSSKLVDLTNEFKKY